MHAKEYKAKKKTATHPVINTKPEQKNRYLSLEVSGRNAFGCNNVYLLGDRNRTVINLRRFQRDYYPEGSSVLGALSVAPRTAILVRISLKGARFLRPAHHLRLFLFDDVNRASRVNILH